MNLGIRIGQKVGIRTRMGNEVSQESRIMQKIGQELKYRLAPRNYILIEGSLDRFGGKPPTLEELTEYVSRNVGIPTSCVDAKVETLAEKFADMLQAQRVAINESQQYEWLRKILQDQKMNDKPPERAARTGYSIYTFYAFKPVISDRLQDDLSASDRKELTNIGDVSGIEIPKMGFVKIPKSIIGHKYVEAGSLNDALGALLRLYSRVNTGESTLTVNIFDRNLSHLESFLIQNPVNRYTR